MHLLGNVGRREVDHNSQPLLQWGRPHPPHQQVTDQLRHKCRLQVNIDEAWASHLTLENSQNTIPQVAGSLSKSRGTEKSLKMQALTTQQRMNKYQNFLHKISEHSQFWSATFVDFDLLYYQLTSFCLGIFIPSVNNAQKQQVNLTAMHHASTHSSHRFTTDLPWKVIATSRYKSCALPQHLIPRVSWKISHENISQGYTQSKAQLCPQQDI